MTKSNKRKQENKQPPTTTFCAEGLAELCITALYALLRLGHDGKMNYRIWAITKLLCAISEVFRYQNEGTGDKIGTCPLPVTRIGLSGIESLGYGVQDRRGGKPS